MTSHEVVHLIMHLPVLHTKRKSVQRLQLPEIPPKQWTTDQRELQRVCTSASRKATFSSSSLITRSLSWITMREFWSYTHTKTHEIYKDTSTMSTCYCDENMCVCVCVRRSPVRSCVGLSSADSLACRQGDESSLSGWPGPSPAVQTYTHTHTQCY